MWHGIVDGRADCLDVALGVIDGARAGTSRSIGGGQVNVVDGGLFFDHPKPGQQIQSPRGGSGPACKISFSSTLFLVQVSVEAEGGEGGGNEHAPVVAHRTGHPEN